MSTFIAGVRVSASRPFLLPRLIRLRDAPHYLGMDRNRFNAEVRPFVTEIRIGIQGIAFDRLDLDAWAEDYKQRNGRPGTPRKGEHLWGVHAARAYAGAAASGTSRNKSEELAAFAKALERSSLKKRSATSPGAWKTSARRRCTE